MQQGVILHSGHVLLLARQAHLRALDNPTDSEVSVALSAAAFEGFINEMAHSAAGFAQELPVLAEFSEYIVKADKDRLETLEKFRKGISILSGDLPRKGDYLPQQLSTLMRLRNSLMHLKPDRVFFEIEGDCSKIKTPKEVKHLMSAGIIKMPSTQAGYTWRHILSDHAVSKWAYGVSIAGMKALVQAIPEHPCKTPFTMRVDKLEDIL